MERIDELLKAKGAWLMRERSSEYGDIKIANKRASMTRHIASYYPVFQPILRAMNKSPNVFTPRDDAQRDMADKLTASRLMHQPNNTTYTFTHPDSKTYLKGGWLEELTYLAIMEAGADAAVFAQKVGWEKCGYPGVNEIDTIARVGDKLTFISCKSMRPDLVTGSAGKSLRGALTKHLDNADNLPDHFGDDDRDSAALVVSMDLIDETKNMPRYTQMFGKAAALDVDVISLDHFEWNKLVERMRALLFD